MKAQEMSYGIKLDPKKWKEISKLYFGMARIWNFPVRADKDANGCDSVLGILVDTPDVTAYSSAIPTFVMGELPEEAEFARAMLSIALEKYRVD